MLLGFTVMQHAFAGGALAQGLVSDAERQALALTGAGYIVWDWDAARDMIHTGPRRRAALGLDDRALNGPVKNWMSLLHPNDRDRFRATLDASSSTSAAASRRPFRLRGDNGQYHWFDLRAPPAAWRRRRGDPLRRHGRRCHRFQECPRSGCCYDSVHDNLTGLENRQLLVNRLDT